MWGGFVRVLVWHWNGSVWLPVFEDVVQMSPSACTGLVQFARATTKPTKCSVPQVHQETEYKNVRYTTIVRVKQKVRKRVNGRWVVRYVWVKRVVWKTKRVPVTKSVTVRGPAQPCFVNWCLATDMPQSFWTSYSQYAWALLTLAHEQSHLAGDVGILVPPGYPSPGWAGFQDKEARAECHGMQRLARVAEELGDTPDDARAVAQFYFAVSYPREKDVIYRGNTYWSADCYENGPLDLSPGDGVWP